MKVIKYKTVTYINRGTEDKPILEEFLMDTVRTYSEMDVEVAAAEAYSGEYEIIDDGQPESSTESILLELAADHEARLCEIELGV